MPDKSEQHLAVVNWDDYQSYDSKSNAIPDWSKLHGGLLLSHDWITGSDTDKATMIVLMILAARYGNRIPYDEGFIQRVGNLSDGVDLSHLFCSGFIETRDGKPGRRYAESDAPVDSAKPKRKREPKSEESALDKWRRKNAGKLKHFDAFWDAYPKCARKIKKTDAQKKWVAGNCDEKSDEILTGLAAWQRGEHWTKDNGEYICLPATFIYQQMWEDAPEATGKTRDELSTLEPGRIW